MCHAPIVSWEIPVYASVGAEYLRLISQGFDKDHVRDRRDDIDRLDIVPVLRFPYTKLPFLTLNTSLTWRNTFWSDSFSTCLNGWNTRAERRPVQSRAIRRNDRRRERADRRAHLGRAEELVRTALQSLDRAVHPGDHRTAIDNFDAILKNEGTDNIVGKSTSYSYGVNTRFYAKRLPTARARFRANWSARPSARPTTPTRVILSATSRIANSVIPLSHFTPVSMLVRTSPRRGTGTFRTDFDGRYSKFKNFGADGSWNTRTCRCSPGGARCVFSRIGKARTSQRPATFTIRTPPSGSRKNRFGVVHNFNWDIQNQSVVCSSGFPATTTRSAAASAWSIRCLI